MKGIYLPLGILLLIIACGCDTKFEISGNVSDGNSGIPLSQALITDCRTGTSVLSGKDGSFSILVQEGDSVSISYVGFIVKTIVAKRNDSVHWNVGLKEFGPIIEPALQHSYSTHPGVSLTVQEILKTNHPIDSIVLYVRNNTDDTVMFGTYYELEFKQDGKWLPMPYNRKFEEGECVQVFSMVGYSYSPHSENKNINDTRQYNEKFEKGIYRMKKTFFVGDSHCNDTVYVEFEIL